MSPPVATNNVLPLGGGGVLSFSRETDFVFSCKDSAALSTRVRAALGRVRLLSAGFGCCRQGSGGLDSTLPVRSLSMPRTRTVHLFSKHNSRVRFTWGASRVASLSPALLGNALT